jgi:hypothetical protein
MLIADRKDKANSWAREQKRKNSSQEWSDGHQFAYITTRGNRSTVTVDSATGAERTKEEGSVEECENWLRQQGFKRVESVATKPEGSPQPTGKEQWGKEGKMTS